MKIGILHKGDKVVAVTEKCVVVQRKNGEADILPIITDETGFRVDTENIITIGYGDNVVEAETEDGVTIVNF